ncbi:unannotated protein [freshwater metagenome]|uniref:Unannotated protein n=1 Tax=freshwater metagenome TaxID=449393 RepID=A0A6J7PT52_9ZZZZ
MVYPARVRGSELVTTCRIRPGVPTTLVYEGAPVVGKGPGVSSSNSFESVSRKWRAARAGRPFARAASWARSRASVSEPAARSTRACSRARYGSSGVSLSNCAPAATVCSRAASSSTRRRIEDASSGAAPGPAESTRGLETRLNGWGRRASRSSLSRAGSERHRLTASLAATGVLCRARASRVRGVCRRATLRSPSVPVPRS